ncbi:MAG TPA: DHA2 family efflux MFS transporter permease subunit [Candidatus Saccharimonadales bacterium]|nr:DHA2 family efflux MFS transporter permease subunit [Candidatus Saccharimonadales bacterium]
MSDTPQAPTPEASVPVTNPWLAAVAVMLATFMEVLDTSIAAVALPYIAGSISATNDEATWVLTSYLVANAIILPASSWFSQRFGRKRFLLTCIVIFTIASFACGAANSLVVILIARAVQGAGGGALQPLSQAILLESFPPHQRGQAMALFGLGVVVAPVLGPTVGGWLTETYSWRWAFYINIPVGIMAIFMIMRYVHDPVYIRDAKPGRFDGIGFGLLAVWLGALQIVLDKGQEDDWFGAVWIRWTVAVLVICLVAFLVRELTERSPLVKLRVFLNRNFLIGSILVGLFGGVIYGMITLLPLLYQELLGYNALDAGMAVSPRGLGSLVAMPLIGIISSRIDNRYLLAFGFALFGVCGLWFAKVNLGISQWSFLWPIILSGFGAGMVFVPLASTSMASLPNEEIGNAAGLFNLMRNIGGSIGISIVNTIIARHEQVHRVEMSRHINAASSTFQHMLSGATALTERMGGSQLQAYSLINGILGQQARLRAYVDDFQYIALVCFGCIPIVFFLKKAIAKKGAISAAH